MQYSKVLLSAAAAAVLTFTGCGGSGGSSSSSSSNGSSSSNDGETPSVIDGKTVVDLSTELTAGGSVTLDSTKIYSINGEVSVASGTTLTIPAGTTLFGETGESYLAVDKGGKIEAAGTAAAPIIFTSKTDVLGNSDSDAVGEWGGLSIFGNAETNKGEEDYEAGAHKFGNDAVNADAVSSGSLTYVAIKHTGYEVQTDAELNGLSLGGVGSGTTIDNVAILGSKDDGIEIWGGTVALSNVYIYNANDDSFDLDHGWTGSVDNILIEQGTKKADHGIESDNDGSNMAATPITDPDISNMTIIGSQVGDEGIKLREGMGGNFNNVTVFTKNPDVASLQVDDPQTVANGEYEFANTTFVSTSGEFVKGSGGTVAEIEAVGNTGAVAKVSPIPATATGADEAAFAWLDNIDSNATGKTVVTLEGTIEADMDLDAANVYAINGEVSVAAGATLTIPAGTILYGETGESYLAVDKGAVINANGTAANPVVFTSKDDAVDREGVSTDEVGEWGGLSIFGNAETNKGEEDYEAGAHKFGNDAVNADAVSSGSLTYVAIKHTGYEVQTDAELNGLSLGGVANTTTIENVAVLGSKDDGIELWGGNVNLTNIFIFNAQDDSFDLDHGYTGIVNNLLIVQGTTKADHGIESDNDGSNMAATPITDPTINNMTIYGSQIADDVIKLREGMGGNFNDITVFSGNADEYALVVDDAQTITNGEYQFANATFISENGNFVKGSAGTVAEIEAVGNTGAVTKADPIPATAIGADTTVFSWIDAHK